MNLETRLEAQLVPEQVREHPADGAALTFFGVHHSATSRGVPSQNMR
jgi:hypothetical protein